jgi:hypothetical protein
MIGDWDVDKYQSPTEPRHHWAIKKKFMEAHKDRYQLTTSERCFILIKFLLHGSLVYGAGMVCDLRSFLCVMSITVLFNYFFGTRG